jgi:hypothetical protein
MKLQWKPFVGNQFIVAGKTSQRILINPSTGQPLSLKPFLEIKIEKNCSPDEIVTVNETSPQLVNEAIKRSYDAFHSHWHQSPGSLRRS